MKLQYKNVISEIWEKSSLESEWHPIDRVFIERYIDDILCIDYVDFIRFNLETFPEIYTSQLFICLPEIWEQMHGADFDIIIDKLQSTNAVLSLIRFTYTYMKVDILSKVFRIISDEKKIFQIKSYLQLQWYTLVDDNILSSFEDGIEKDFLKYEPAQWSYIRQRLLIDKEVSEACKSPNQLANYLKKAYKIEIDF